MPSNRFLCRTARNFSRSGFTLVELLVVIGIIAILAGVALGPITRGIKQAQESTSMQVCRQIGLLEFSYSNDNNQVYPYSATTAEVIANNLLNGNYASDPTLFYIASTPNAVKPTAAVGGVYAQTSKFCCFDFMVNTTTAAGLSSTAGDSTPLCELTGANYTMATTGGASGIFANLDTTKTAFAADGIAVTYKSNSAVFLRATVTGATSAVTTLPIVPPSYTDPVGNQYALVLP
jgi:prepilin-type N-terminal cleavage/methylation domain-containing protein